MPPDLLDALRDLRVGMQSIRHASEQPFPMPPLTALQAAVEALGQDRPAQALICPEEYLELWRKLQAGVGIELGLRAVRYLAWEPEVVLNPQFHYYLEEHELDLGARSLQGLIRACHLRWAAFVKDETMKRIAVSRLRTYRGPNRIVTRWQASIEKVLATGAPDALAEWMLEALRSPRIAVTEWSIDEGSTFFLETMRALGRKARARWRGNAQIVSFVCQEVLGWEGWPLDALKLEVSESILHPTARDAEVNGPLRTLVFRHPHLGDPRLPQKRTNWLGILPEAKQRIIEWLSRDDIVFFFDHAFPKGGDPHRRKPFWLRYVSSVVMSRPLLSRNDAARLRAHLRQLGSDVGNYGAISGNNSAFLLDFGSLCAIEFNHIGACYLYERRAMDEVVLDFWAHRCFTESGLKRQSLRLARIIHKPGWEEELQIILARFGVRPK